MAWTLIRYIADPRADSKACIMLGTGGSPNGVQTAPQGTLAIDESGATPDTILYLNTDGASAWSAFPALPMAVGDITLARGRLIRGSAGGIGEAVTGTAGQIPIHDGTDVAFGDPADAGSYYPAVGLADILQEIVASMCGVTSTTVRSYSGGVLQEPPDNATLTAALASLMLLRQDMARQLVMDTRTPTAEAGKGLVVSGGEVTAQAVPDATVIVASSVSYSQLGPREVGSAVAVLPVTDPNPLGGVRNDLVVIPAGGGAAVIREGTVIATDPGLTAGDRPLARLRCPNGAVTITGAEIDDLRNTTLVVPPAKLYPYANADIDRLFPADVIDAAWLLQAITNGSFAADAATRALFGDGIWPVAKMAPDVMLEATGTIPGGTGAGKVGSLNTNPLNLIAAPAAGSMIIVDEVEWLLDYASAAYDGVAAGELLTLVHTGATDPLVSGLSTGFGDQASDQRRVANRGATACTSVPAAGIDAYCLSGDWYAAAGDSPLKYRIRYHIVTALV